MQAYQALIKWAQTPQAQKIAKTKKEKAWEHFLFVYPSADKSKFVAEVEFTKDHTGTAEIYYKEGDGGLLDVFGSDRKYWSEDVKKALGLNKSSGFPPQLTPSGIKVSSLPVPAVGFHDQAPSLKKIFNGEMKIYATPDEYFTTKFREIFQKTKLKHTTGKESRKWLAGKLSLPPNVRNFYLFHVYFTVRRILFQMG